MATEKQGLEAHPGLQTRKTGIQKGKLY